MTEITNEIQEKLQDSEPKADKDNTASTKATSNPIDLNNLTTEQVQNLKELFAKTPQRVSPEQTYHTVQLREIGGKVIIAWEQTYFAKKRDTINHMDVMKTIIPVLYHGSAKYQDILWREEFMEANKVTCKIIKMETSEERKPVGVTYKRNSSGEKTNEEVERYVVNTKVTYLVRLPDGEEVNIDSSFIN